MERHIRIIEKHKGKGKGSEHFGEGYPKTFHRLVQFYKALADGLKTRAWLLPTNRHQYMDRELLYWATEKES